MPFEVEYSNSEGLDSVVGYNIVADFEVVETVAASESVDIEIVDELVDNEVVDVRGVVGDLVLPEVLLELA